MDGHDNDANNTNSANNSAPQGIFSTPELTVDAEKISQNQQATSEASRAKIASIFANTETGKQNQRLNEAVIANTTPATEDIVLDNGPKKRSKWPIVLAVLVLLAAVGGVVAYLVLNNTGQQTTRETPESAFNSYLEYLEKGPEEYRQEDQESSEWFLFTVNQNPDLSSADRKNYLHTLQQKYASFLQVLPSGNKELSNVSRLYGENLTTLIKLQQLSLSEDELLAIFNHKSPKDAYDYIEEQTDGSNSADMLISSSYASLKKYLTLQLSLLENYSANDCIESDEINYECTIELLEKSANVQELSQNQQQAYSAIVYNIVALEDYIQTTTDELRTIVRDTHNE